MLSKRLASEYHRIVQATSNGGLNWIDQTSYQSGINYRSVHFIDSLTGWVVGDSGIILKTTTGGVLTNFSNISSEIPNKYFLSQNYPNPFNPTTVIRYSLIENRFVSLKVYNLLGNEVKTLVEQKQNAGSYEVEFNGQGLSSGIYYYRIAIHSDRIGSNDFNQTKKMLLIK